MNIPASLVSGIVGIIFGAGVAWTTLKRYGRDLNGLGRKQGLLEREMMVLLMLWCPAEDRKWLAEVLLRK